MRMLQTRTQDAAPAVAHAMPASGQKLPSATRLAMEQGFDFDFANLRIHDDAATHRTASSLGVAAYAFGNDVGFAKGVYSEGAAGQHVLAHELAHVVQQQRGETQGLASHGAASERARLERGAEADARAVTSGVRLQRRPSGIAAPVLQGFDPDYHEQALIQGAAGSFTPEETGKIYEANWRRDFSQAAPALADVALIWKNLKDAAPADRLKLQAQLAGEILAIVRDPTLAAGETYGGYQSWEHMDNPGGAATAEADARWGGAGGGLAGYILDSRAYIKQNLAEAVAIARKGWNPPDDDVGKRLADAWANGKPPKTWDTGPYAGGTMPPQGLGTPKQVTAPNQSSSVVAADVTAIAKGQSGAIATATRGFMSDPQVADDLGRSSHALEDFFAHSNFVELSQRPASGPAITAKDLRTGTFGTGDKAHSLADKIQSIVDAIRAHRDLIPTTVLPDLALSEFAAVADTLDALASATTGAPTGSPKATSHTALNKDEPTRPNFAMAHQLAIAGDKLVFESIHRAMQASLPKTASQIVYDTYAIVDLLVAIPSDTHPLKHVYRP